MQPMEVIQSSTKIAADCLGLEDRGTLVTGNKADLLILDENPCKDLRVLRNEKTIIKDGCIIE